MTETSDRWEQRDAAVGSIGQMTAEPDDAARSFFREIVEPTVVEFLEQPADRRRGCLACLCLSSMSDHYFHARPKSVDGCANPNAFRVKLGDTNWAVKQVFGVANATKHVKRRTGRVGYEDVTEVARRIWTVA